MWQHFIKTTFRNLRAHPLYSLINLLGMAVSFAACFFLLTFIRHELSYDEFYGNSDRLYRVTTKFNNGNHWGVATFNAGPVLDAEIAGIEKAARFAYSTGALLEYENEKRHVEGVFFVDSTALEVVDFPLLHGDAATALDDPKGLVITENAAREWFGRDDVVGEILTIHSEDTSFQLAVSAVIETLPDNSSIELDYLIPFAVGRQMNLFYEGWDNYGPLTFVLIPPTAQIGTLEVEMTALVKERAGDDAGEFESLHLQRLTNMHLHGTDGERSSALIFVGLFAAVGILLLLIACLNFMNLSTARAMVRAKEIGIRKVVGAERQVIVVQFLSESLTLALVAALCAAVLIELFLPAFNQLADTHFASGLVFSSAGLYLLGIAVVAGLLAGSYPAWRLSGFRPIDVIKGQLKSGKKAVWLRQGLVITQFTMAAVLVICTLAARDQLRYLREMNAGYDREQVIYLDAITGVESKYDRLKRAFEAFPEVVAVSATSSLPTYIGMHGGIPDFPGRDPNLVIDFLFNQADFDYVETFGMEIVRGRDFNPSFATDSTAAYILNETAVRQMGLDIDSIIDMPISFWGQEGRVIGVLKDFQTGGFREPIDPLILMAYRYPTFTGSIAIRVQPGNPAPILNDLESAWKQVMGEVAFDYHFLDEAFAETFEREERTGQVFAVFAILGIFVSCLGLFGLATFVAEQRRKEIGVRKVLGAGTPRIVRLLGADFTWPVLLGFALAAGVSWVLIHRYIEQFAFHAPVRVLPFAIAAGILIATAWLTVSYQSLRAAHTDPVRALRDE